MRRANRCQEAAPCTHVLVDQVDADRDVLALIVRRQDDRIRGSHDSNDQVKRVAIRCVARYLVKQNTECTLTERV